MKRWRRFSLWAIAALTGFVIIIFATFVWLFCVPPRSYQKIGGRWFSATETPPIAESGRKPKFLVRGGMFLRKTVAEDITSFHYLGDDCIVYTVAGYGQDEMYARCGDHDPVFLDHVPDHQKVSMVSDPLQFNGTTMDVVYRRLRWENVSLERRTYTIPHSKNGDPFHGRLNRAGLAAVREFLKRGDGTGAVVRNLAGKPLDTEQGRPDHWFKPALEKAEIANLHWHDLRHTFASRLIMAGGNLRAAAEAMGHKTLSMVMRCSHLSPDFQQGTVDLLDSFGKRTDTATSTGPKHEISERPEYVN